MPTPLLPYIIEAGGTPAFTWRGSTALSALASFVDSVFPRHEAARIVPTGNDDEAHMIVRVRLQDCADVFDLYAYPAVDESRRAA